MRVPHLSNVAGLTRIRVRVSWGTGSTFKIIKPQLLLSLDIFHEVEEVKIQGVKGRAVTEWQTLVVTSVGWRLIPLTLPEREPYWSRLRQVATPATPAAPITPDAGHPVLSTSLPMCDRGPSPSPPNTASVDALADITNLPAPSAAPATSSRAEQLAWLFESSDEDSEEEGSWRRGRKKEKQHVCEEPMKPLDELFEDVIFTLPKPISPLKEEKAGKREKKDFDEVKTKKREKKDFDEVKTKKKKKKRDDKSKLKEEEMLMSEKEDELVNEYWKDGDGHEVIIAGHNMEITRRDVHTLKPQGWVNDNIIDAYLSLLSHNHPSIAVFSTHFFTKLQALGFDGVKRWKREEKLFNQRMVLFPIHLKEIHWVLVVVWPAARTISYLDSAHNNDWKCVAAIKAYLMRRHHQETGLELCLKEWNINSRKDIPKQTNTDDCGIHLMRNARALAEESTLKIEGGDLNQVRRRMVLELHKFQLLKD